MWILQPVAFRGRLVAAASPERFFLNDPLDALESDHPDRLFVSFMCCYARDVMRGALPGPYSDDHAALYARCALIDDDDFVRLAHFDDAELAEHFGVPLDQIAPKRHDLDPPERVARGRRG